MALYVHTAEITIPAGNSFPIDMLRYDSCFPVGHEAVEAIIDACKLRMHKDLKPLTIKVAKHSATKQADWTVGRWASFGVLCIPTTAYKVS